MLLASLHILSVPMTMQVKPLVPLRSVRMEPSLSTRTTAAPSATAFGAAERAAAVYWESDVCAWGARVGTANRTEKVAIARAVHIVRMEPPLSLIDLERRLEHPGDENVQGDPIERKRRERRRVRKPTSSGQLFGEEAGLGGGSCRGGFAAGDANDAENGEFGKGGARNEDTVGIGAEIGWSDLDAVVEEVQKVIRNDAFEGFAVRVAKADPKTVQFGAAEENFALGLVVAFELADEVDGANPRERDFFVLAVGSE